MRIYQLLLPVLSTFLFFPDELFAQENALSNPNQFYVLHQNRIAQKDIARANAVQDSIFTPILNELVEEGTLVDWGHLVHAWGMSGTSTSSLLPKATGVFWIFGKPTSKN